MLLVVERWNREPALIFRVGVEVDLTQMTEIRMKRVRSGVFARDLLVGLDKTPSFKLRLILCVYRTPTFLQHRPMDRCVWDDLFQTLELSGDQGAMSYKSALAKIQEQLRTPWTSIRHIEMISILFWRKLGARLPRDEVSKGRLSSLELAGLVSWRNPVRDLVLVAGLGIQFRSCESIG